MAITNAEVLVKTLDIDHVAWLEMRKKGIGGSDVSAICGINPWKSPIGVYLDKIGQAQPIDENERMYWGNVLEPVIAEEFARRTGYKVQRKNAILHHPENPWALANVDRLIINKEKGHGVLEIKTASEYVKGEWQEGKIPDNYFLQLQWYLYVTGLKWGAFAALVGGNKFFYYEVERDDELIEILYEKCKTFWFEHVQAKNPPAPDGSADTDDILKSMYPQSDSQEELCLDNFEETVEQLDEVKAQIDGLEKEKSRLEQLIKTEMKTAEKATVGDRKVTWKSVSSTRIDSKLLKAEEPEIYEKYSKESSSRRFTIK